ncbi:uncharacterized protein LOC124932316 [Impatiens glandulifera]|uniref:uncharacterized protein LOC124932316 n=1 Tax=Impatiens glandulifera TaxID=253017 RepID=UPI001FB0C0D2|nr:uncharacterized protein LOC124932316 [Impatiens glandulifera]
MKIQPVDINFNPVDDTFRNEPAVKPVLKSRLRRLFERNFPVRLPSVETNLNLVKHGSGEFDPSSVCLAKMVQNFIEYGSDKQDSLKCNSKSCNCFNRNCGDNSEEDNDSSDFSSADACRVLKSLVQCACVVERKLLGDTSRIVENNKFSKLKDECCRKIVTDGLIALGYDASICKSRWEKSSLCPAGEYEFVDVLIEGGERFIIDIAFRSEFEIARSTKTYKSILQKLPNIFVGKSERLQSIISIVSEAAKQSLKKKGMHFPPWRKAEYVKAKWLSPCTRTKPNIIMIDKEEVLSDDIDEEPTMFALTAAAAAAAGDDDDEEENKKKWELPKVGIQKPLSGVKMVTGLASVINDNNP